jgi:hypothetical protein
LNGAVREHVTDAEWSIDEFCSGSAHRLEGNPYDASVIAIRLDIQSLQGWIDEEDPAAPFLLTSSGKRILRAGAEQAFCSMRSQAKVQRHDGGRYQPRLHDLRHTAAVMRLTGIAKEFLSDVETHRGCGIATRNQRLAAIHAIARFVDEHSP